MICILTLASLVWVFSISMKTEMTLARNADYDQEMEWMGRSGIELARFALANKSPEQRNIDALNQYWAGGSSTDWGWDPEHATTAMAMWNELGLLSQVQGRYGGQHVEAIGDVHIFIVTRPRTQKLDTVYCRSF